MLNDLSNARQTFAAFGRDGRVVRRHAVIQPIRSVTKELFREGTDVLDRQTREFSRVAPLTPAPTGVVFVHGMGTQPQSDTLRHFGGPLIKWLTEWHTARGYVPDQPGGGLGVDEAHLVLDDAGARPAWFLVDLPATSSPDRPGAAATWLLAEAWWS